MAGVKGRSGRRPLGEEERRLRVIDKAWDLIEKRLNDDKISIQVRSLLAEKIVLRSMPTQLEHSGDIKYTRMTSIVIEHKTQELDFGEDIKLGDSRTTADTGQAISSNNGD